MFMDFGEGHGPVSPTGGGRPEHRGPALDRQDERRLLTAIAFNLVVLIVAPVGGATLLALLFL
jgi:hypothetical protein